MVFQPISAKPAEQLRIVATNTEHQKAPLRTPIAHPDAQSHRTVAPLNAAGGDSSMNVDFRTMTVATNRTNLERGLVTRARLAAGNRIQLRRSLSITRACPRNLEIKTENSSPGEQQDMCLEEAQLVVC